jgi:large subunit ribosomal protein L29
MKKQDLSKLSVAEIEKQLLANVEAYKKMKIGHKVTPIENPLQIQHARKQIARLNTELTKLKKQA